MNFRTHFFIFLLLEMFRAVLLIIFINETMQFVCLSLFCFYFCNKIIKCDFKKTLPFFLNNNFPIKNPGNTKINHIIFIYFCCCIL